MRFSHLHVHTYFSFGIGASSPEALVAAAVVRGIHSLACTDTNGVYGAVEFQKAAESLGVRPILGAHLSWNGQETVALAADERGWAALCRAITAIHWGKGATLAGIVAQDREGLILLSQDIGFLENVLQLSGPRDLYAELVPGRQRHAVLAAARRLGLAPVATNAVVAANAEDWTR
ncbi:MAG TPA: PHP domain-containing protein, partial [Gemmatimonadales bacterium]|nr:PHP domain-containing protein [Gemmatimonadales bacterium]